MKHIKYLLFLSILCSLVLFTNCGDSDDPVADGITSKPTLTITISPSGGGSVSPQGGTYDAGTTVELTATANVDYTFTGWTGDFTGSSNPVTLTMLTNQTVIANFELHDADGDGVGDSVDNCAETASDATVDENGCSDSQKDTDGDGIADDLDNCPNSPEGGYVDEEGCPVVCSTTYNPTTVEIGNQVWTSSNVDVTTYCDGTVIPQVTLSYNTTNGLYDNSEWYALTTGAWIYARDCDCGAVYTFSTEEEEGFGKLYNWYAIMGIHDNDESTPNKQFASEGWRIPTAEDFDTLFMNNTGPALRSTGSVEAGTGLWFTTFTNSIEGTNESGFSAIPAGIRSSNSWGGMGYSTIFWTSSVEDVIGADGSIIYDAMSFAQITNHDQDEYNKMMFTTEDKWNGFSVRLVKNLE